MIKRATAAIAVAGLLLAACGSDDNTGATGAGASTDSAASKDCATGTLSGAGSTFVQTIVQQWVKDYTSACPGATVNYQGVGSGAGIQQFTAGTVDFGATDAQMKPDERAAAEAKHGPVLEVPWSAGAVAVIFKLDGVKDLKLKAATLAGIFTGKITSWDDAAIKADNPGVKLPSLGIQVVHRSDGSGTTNAFTTFLSEAAPSVWTAGKGKDVAWPTGQGAKGSDGVTAAVKQGNGGITYAELSFAKTSDALGTAQIENATGAFVGPDAEAVSAALADPKSEKAYPISTPTWVLIPAKPSDPGKAKLLRSFIEYALDDGQDKAEDLFYAPLPAKLRIEAADAVEDISA